MAADYSIWSFCYARGRLPTDFMGGALVNSNRGLTDIPMVYSLVMSEPGAKKRRVMLVDTGFKDGISMSGRSFENVEMPDAILAKVGIAPKDIDTVLLTHLHFDHAGNFDFFPNAEIFVQRREFEQWKAAIARVPDLSVGKQNWILSSIDVDVLNRVEKAIGEGRVTLIDGDKEIAEGITCRLAEDTHTFGSQWVEVATPEGPHVVAGDCVYWYTNLERMWPPGYVQGNAWNLMHTYERLKGLVGEDRLQRIVPGHDMETFTRNKSWIAGLNPVAEIHLAKGETSRVR